MQLELLQIFVSLRMAFYFQSFRHAFENEELCEDGKIQSQIWGLTNIFSVIDRNQVFIYA